MKTILIFAFALLALASCKKEEPEPTKRIVGFKFTCAKPFDAKAIFDGQTKEIKGDSGVVYMEFEYVEENEGEPVHNYQICITSTHDDAIAIRVSGASTGHTASLVGPGNKCSEVYSQKVY